VHAEPDSAQPDRRDHGCGKEIGPALAHQHGQRTEQHHVHRGMAAWKAVTMDDVEMWQKIGAWRGEYLLEA